MIFNKVKTEGNSIYIRSNPATGIIALTSFVDNAFGESGTAFFTKTFRYTLNGIIYSDWFELTPQNILSIPVTSKDVLVIELQYQKNPVGTQGIQVSEATLGTTNATVEESDLFKNTIFYQFFGSGDVEVLNWMINVLEKLFHKGLIPNYIDRYNEMGSPDDFIEFWGSICKFLAYYVVYARKYQKFYESEVLLTEYLEERGIKTSPEMSLPELQVLMQKYNREIARRGTYHIVDKKGLHNALLDGELLRLINYRDGDEFLFNPSKPEHTGWNLGNSSPLYRSVTIQDNFNKFYEQGSEPEDISKYPVTGSVAVETDPIFNKKAILIEPQSSIGDVAMPDPYFIPVDEYLDYEFSFYVWKQIGENLTVGFDAYDKDGNHIDLLSRTDGTVLNNYFEDKDLQRDDKYLYLRFFLYNKFKPLYEYDGLNLKMAEGVKYVVPKIKMSNGKAYVYNIRFLPMALPYSKGFIQVNNFIDLFIKNNNKQLTTFDINDYIKKYLIPYSSHIKVMDLEKAGDYSLEVYTPVVVGQVPTVTTSTPSGINSNQALLGGEVTADGGSSVNERGIVWGTASAPNIKDNRCPNGFGLGQFSALVTGFPPATTIYIRAYAINGNGIAYGNEVTFTTENTVKVLSIEPSGANPSNATEIQFKVIFSSAVTGVVVSNFEIVATGVLGAFITGVTGSGSTYIVTVNTGSGSGTIGLNLANATGINFTVTNVPFTGSVYTVDKTAPSATIDSKPASSSNSSSAMFSFSGVDTGGSGIDGFLISIDNGAFVSGSSPVSFTNLSNGSHTFAVKAFDKAGNEGSAAIYTWNIDAVAPFVQSIVRVTPPDATIDDTVHSVLYRITFSKQVIGVDLVDFFLQYTGSVQANIVSVEQVLATAYDVAINNISGTGSLTLCLKPSGSGIQDTFGNPLGSTITSGETYTIEPSLVLDGGRQSGFIITNSGNGVIENVSPTFYLIEQGSFPVETNQTVKGSASAGTFAIQVQVYSSGDGASKIQLYQNHNLIGQYGLTAFGSAFYTFDSITISQTDLIELKLV